MNCHAFLETKMVGFPVVFSAVFHHLNWSPPKARDPSLPCCLIRDRSGYYKKRRIYGFSKGIYAKLNATEIELFLPISLSASISFTLPAHPQLKCYSDFCELLLRDGYYAMRLLHMCLCFLWSCFLVIRNFLCQLYVIVCVEISAFCISTLTYW